jgi:hypothetical protein
MMALQSRFPCGFLETKVLSKNFTGKDMSELSYLKDIGVVKTLMKALRKIN